jgi:hypothetical protein
MDDFRCVSSSRRSHREPEQSVDALDVRVVGRVAVGLKLGRAGEGGRDA